MLKIISLSVLTIGFIALGTFFMNEKIEIVEKSAIAENKIEEVISEDSKNGPSITLNKQEINMEDVVKDRIFGDSNAPIRIDKIVSLSCGHCAKFQKQVSPSLKENFIDTGKAYIVYHDYPLNINALHAASIARCMPINKFEKYIDLLFNTQHSWSHDENYPKALIQNSKLAGLSGEMIEKCMNSTEIQEYIMKDIDFYIKTYNVSSTPTLIINKEEVLSYTSYPELEKILNTHYENSIKK